MASTYDAFDKATGSFRAVALVLNGEPVGRIVVKFGTAATAYVQIWGAEMARGRATGYGYDKASTAVAEAASRLLPQTAYTEAMLNALKVLRDAFKAWDGGTQWERVAEEAGFTIARVI